MLPQLGEVRLYECDVAHVDAFFTRLEHARRTVEHEDGSTAEKVRYAANTRPMNHLKGVRRPIQGAGAL